MPNNIHFTYTIPYLQDNVNGSSRFAERKVAASAARHTNMGGGLIEIEHIGGFLDYLPCAVYAHVCKTFVSEVGYVVVLALDNDISVGVDEPPLTVFVFPYSSKSVVKFMHISILNGNDFFATAVDEPEKCSAIRITSDLDAVIVENRNGRIESVPICGAIA